MNGLEMRYFVLKPSASGIHGKACRAALRAYSNVVVAENPELAADLNAWANVEDEKLGEPPCPKP